ncbi:alpha/beta fold hydrolase [Sphingobium sp. Sx8-8]|uniref:alpha/beta fold hydrolase n=1 Tax=Sphingobium sp. Sx8-8 TaxID=2933617 RepID=UPI001F5A01F5|nr:alpha/beta fold hydrolase [Sphingobium sp. Sx8-8]
MHNIAFTGAAGNVLAASRCGGDDAPAVLLVPTVGQTRHIWHGAAEALERAGRQAICLDLRGHGDSAAVPDGRYALEDYAADLKAVLGQLPSRATVVGLGGGGLAAIIAAGESTPGLVSGLVLVGVTARVDAAVSERIGGSARRLAEAFDSPDALRAALADVHPGEPTPTSDLLLSGFKEGADGRWRWAGDPSVVGAFDLIGNSARIEAAAARIKVPTTLIRGALNESVSYESTLRLSGLIYGSELKEIAGGGHHIVADQADAFNAVLLEFLEDRVPLSPISYQSGDDPRLLRDALGCFGTGVTVVTTMSPQGEPIGFTANSFASVSLDPPLVLFCIAKRSANLEQFSSAPGFAINVLHIGQQPTSDRFARPNDSRFDGVPWEVRVPGGSPFLIGSRASLDCRTHAIHDGGDHLIVVGEVRQADFEPHRDPLLYIQGKYRRVHFT